MKLSLNFNLEEFTTSETAIRKGIDNIPSDEIIANIIVLCSNVLEPLEELINKQIIISSGYRSKELNSEIGGAKNSQHVEGKAADIKVKDISTEDLFQIIIKSEIEYDQIIQEFDKWVHISYNEGKNRKQKLRATKDQNNKTIYTIL